MKFFLDSANIDEIKKATYWNVIDGVTTNPTLLAKEKKDYKEIIEEIMNIAKGPISVEVMSNDTEGMIKEAIELNKLGKLVIKIPMTPDGLKAVKILEFEKNIRTNVTLIFSVNQILLAAKAGATYASIFIGRLDDIGNEGMQVLKDAVKIFNTHTIETEIIAASIRDPIHVIEAAIAGTDIATIPFNILEKMFKHPLTDIGIERFRKDWEMTKIEY